jgi:hypothetical protein
MLRHAAVALVLAAMAAPAFAQDADAEKIKQSILEKVRARIQEEHKKILEKLSAVIDAELARAGGAKPEAGAAGAAGGDSAKKMKDLQRKLTQLEDQREDLLRDIRNIKREDEDAGLRRDADKIPLEAQTLSDIFQKHLDAHSAAVPMLKTDREKAVAEFRKTIDGFKQIWYRLRGNTNPAAMGLSLPAAYNVACGYSLIGEKEQALDWIEIAIAAGYQDFEHMRADSDFDNLRKERRYQRILLDR